MEVIFQIFIGFLVVVFIGILIANIIDRLTDRLE